MYRYADGTTSFNPILSKGIPISKPIDRDRFGYYYSGTTSNFGTGRNTSYGNTFGHGSTSGYGSTNQYSSTSRFGTSGFGFGEKKKKKTTPPSSYSGGDGELVVGAGMLVVNAVALSSSLVDLWYRKKKEKKERKEREEAKGEKKSKKKKKVKKKYKKRKETELSPEVNNGETQQQEEQLEPQVPSGAFLYAIQNALRIVKNENDGRFYYVEEGVDNEGNKKTVVVGLVPMDFDQV